MNEAVARFIAERRDELLTLLADLVAAPSVNPPGDEDQAAAVVEAWFNRHGIAYKIHEREPHRTNIVGRVGGGAPRLLVACHLDVVPPGTGWESDPFKAVVTGGRVYGRGVVDDKGPLAAMCLAGACLHEMADELRGEVILAAVADEEHGSEMGLEFLLAEGLIVADMAIVPDVAENMNLIDVAEKGAAFIEVVSRGKQAHGSMPERGVNAIANMVPFLARLKDLRLPYNEHPRLTPPTVNLGMIQGGSAPNLVPAECTAAIDIRYLPGTKFEEVMAVIMAAIAETERETGGRFEVRTLTDMAPTEAPSDSPLVQALVAATREVTGREPRVGGLSGATVAKQLIFRGIPAVGCGPGEAEQLHASNESIVVAELVDFARVLVLAALRLVGKPS